MELLWDPLGARVAQDVIWTASGNLFGGLLGTPGSHLGTKVGQDGAMWANLATKMPNLGPLWATVWSILGILGAIFPKISESAKTNDPPSLLLDF